MCNSKPVKPIRTADSLLNIAIIRAYIRAIRRYYQQLGGYHATK